jgi:NhaP-type Na+/H+ or K+/H+ antiporter
MAWQFVITFPIREMTRDEEARTSTRERLMLGWSGMRGGISLAAALSLPLTVTAGAPFPLRDFIIFVTFGVILLTLVGQGLTLPPLVRRLGLAEDEREETDARVESAHAALPRPGGVEVGGLASTELARCRRLGAGAAPGVRLGVVPRHVVHPGLRGG